MVVVHIIFPKYGYLLKPAFFMKQKCNGIKDFLCSYYNELMQNIFGLFKYNNFYYGPKSKGIANFDAKYLY